MEPVSIGELLTFTSSIILLIITWKSVSNAKKANENAHKANIITEQSQDLQREQFHLGIKPDLIFKISPIKYTSEQNDKHRINEILNPDHPFEIENISSNTCYEVSTTTVVYLPNGGWDKFLAFRAEKYKPRYRPNTAIHQRLHALHSENKLDCHIPFAFLILNIVSYDGTIPQPQIFTFLKYRDKTNKLYEECFRLDEAHSVIGRKDRPDDIEILFRATQVDFETTKQKVYEQKEKLDNEFSSESKSILFV
uniref:Uncharacterized protein n=1 Tax=Planococcus citreus TaxID=1373 RepID=K7XP68_9BACL|nr:hypothetical protein [Planococcus citreus]AFX82607.1 hypothetical protein [Planococcus citreus]